MKYSILIFISIAFLFSACNSKNNTTSSSTDGQSASATATDPCTIYAETLNGTFSSKFMEGTMKWSGGTSGTVEISGLDYNDMTCTYVLNDCAQGIVNMNCNGGAYDTQLIIYNTDSLKLGPTAYYRLN